MAGEEVSVDIAVDVTISATPDVVFNAIVEAPGAWWGHPFLSPAAIGLKMDATLGGSFTETWPDGGRVVATVTGLARPSWIQLTGAFHLGLAMAVADVRMTEVPQGTQVALTFRAFGPVDEHMAGAFAGGWRELLAERLKAFVENGIRMGVDQG